MADFEVRFSVSTTPPKFNSSPPKLVTETQKERIDERIVFLESIVRGELLNFAGVVITVYSNQPILNICFFLGEGPKFADMKKVGDI